MRTDGGLPETLRGAESWETSVDDRGVLQQDAREVLSSSFSGHERNRLFLNHEGEQFLDVSALSGVDTAADSRSWAQWDFDRDGWTDVALVNANRPWLNVFRNRIGERHDANFVAVRFVGGNHAATPASGLACRDGFGALVTLEAPGWQIVREHRCGEGFATQNSRTLLVGIGAHEQVDLTVHWPSGAVQQKAAVPAGSLVTVRERPSGEDPPFVVEPYARSVFRRRAAPAVGTPVVTTSPALVPQRPFNLYTTMATWCPACRAHIPELSRLREEFSAEQLDLIAIPVDPRDDSSKLEHYLDAYQPAYRLVMDLPEEDRRTIEEFLQEQLTSVPLPASYLTDQAGRVLEVYRGLPTHSDLAPYLQNR